MAGDKSSRGARGLGARLDAIASAFAVLGGFVLCGLIVLVVVSVLGRALFARPVPGDFEIVGFGISIAIFLFLPYCYLKRGNVTVDVLLGHTPPGLERLLDGLAGVVSAAVALLFAWRLALGLADVFSYGDISMIVGIPLWWAYPFGIASFALLAAVAIHTALYGFEDSDDEF